MVSCLITIIAADSSLNAKCRDLLTCTIRKKCAQIDYLSNSFQGSNITAKLYTDLDKVRSIMRGYLLTVFPFQAIDYGCIFTSGCLEECNRCPLCQTSKEQLVDVLSGTRRELGGECATLVNCATDCIESSTGDLTKINYCLRQKCAFHCFDGSCPKCSAFITRIFNQVCVSGDFRNRVVGFEVSLNLVQMRYFHLNLLVIYLR